jgi:hypothetical protein
MVIGAVVLGALAVPASAQFPNWLWNGHMDYPLPASPCPFNVDIVHTQGIVHQGQFWTLTTCADNTVWMRQFTAPLPGPPPVPEQWNADASSITCPGPHSACALLPAGTYDRVWANGIGR